MGFWDRHILPPLLDWAMGQKPIMRQRRKIVPEAEGEVLEVGLGTGRNLSFYDRARVTRLVGLDPAAELTGRAAKRAQGLGLPIEVVGLSGEAMPFAEASFDTVVMTYTLCSIPQPGAALKEIRRVLKPSGRLLFCEHGRAPDADVRAWQERIEPRWKPWCGGCHLTRDPAGLICEHGFTLDQVETMYLPGPRPLTFNYWGAARPA